MRGKTATYGDRKEVIYSEEHWKILRQKRERARAVMERLHEFGLEPILYGSVARGDVTKDSDVDIFIPLFSYDKEYQHNNFIVPLFANLVSEVSAINYHYRRSKCRRLYVFDITRMLSEFVQ